MHIILAEKEERGRLQKPKLTLMCQDCELRFAKIDGRIRNSVALNQPGL
jgi:uncharacterized protein YlaI